MLFFRACRQFLSSHLASGHSWASSSFGFPDKGCHSRFSISIWSYILHSPPSLQPLPCPLSLNLVFGLPHFLFPGSSILSHLFPIYPSYFLLSCPNHLSLASRVVSPNHPTCAVPPMDSFLILSILVTPNENRNIFHSATSISASSLFSPVPPSPARTTLLCMRVDNSELIVFAP